MKLFTVFMLVFLPVLALADFGRTFFDERIIGGRDASPNAWPWQVIDAEQSFNQMIRQTLTQYIF